MPDTPPAHVTGPTVRCRWCGYSAAATGETSCPRCGATLAISVRSDTAGWSELPPVANMTRIKLGDSTCQIEGQTVPVADFNLRGQDGIFFSHHYLLWRDVTVSLNTMSIAGGIKRLLGGLPLFLTRATGPGHLALSRDVPGEIIAIPLDPGQEVDVREHMFLAATGPIDYQLRDSNIWFQQRSGQDNNDVETFYPIGWYVDRFFSDKQPGLLLLHCSGNCFTRMLGPDETLLVKPTAFVFKDKSVHMQLHFEYPQSNQTYTGLNPRLMGYRPKFTWVALRGPGRVAIQSAYEPMEGEYSRVDWSSACTNRAW